MHLRKSRPKLVILKPYTYLTLVPFSQQRYLRNNDAAVAFQGDRPPLSAPGLWAAKQRKSEKICKV